MTAFPGPSSAGSSRSDGIQSSRCSVRSWTATEVTERGLLGDRGLCMVDAETGKIAERPRIQGDGPTCSSSRPRFEDTSSPEAGRSAFGPDHPPGR